MRKRLLFLSLAFIGIFGGSAVGVAAEKTTSPYTGITIEQAAGRSDLYLYNVESGYWLQDNNRNTGWWNTRANLDAYGFDVAISAIDGGYQINPKFNHNNSLNGSNWYLDTGDPITAWTFNAITKEGVSNAYQIKYGDDWLHATPESENYQLIRNNVVARATWQIVTREERMNYLIANATPENPIDATFLIQGHNLANEDSRVGSWVEVKNDGNSDWNREYMCMRAHGYWNTTTVKYYQTINNVPDGVYEFYCTGFYRDGNRDQCQARRQAGTETIRGYYFINDVREPLKSILDGAQTNAVSGFQYRNDTYTFGFFPDNGGDVTKAFFDKPEAYLNAPIQATVVGGNITLGIEKTNYTGGGDWVFFSRFRLRYLGPIDISEYTDALNSAIEEAEAFSGNTTDILASNLSTALEEAKAVVDSHDTDVLSEKAGNLTNALNAAKAVDVSVLRPSVEYAKAKGVNVSAQEDYLVNGTSTDVASQLNAVIISVKQHYAETSPQPTVFTMISESVVGTDDNNRGAVVTDHADGFYVYNVGTGRWFCGGDDWGAHAAVGFPGIKITTPEDNYGSGQYNKVKTWLFNGNWNDGGLLGNNGYCDTGGNAWKFWKQNAAQGIYTWSNNGDNTGNNTGNGCGTKDLVGFTLSTTYARVDVHQSGADNPYNQWIFVTEAQRDEMAAAAMATASESNPVDLTYKIKMPGFNQRERKEGTNQSSEELDWTCNHANYCYNASDNGSRKIIMGRGDNHADFVCDIYGYSWNDAFSWTQTVTGLTPGSYRVKVQGYNNGGSDANKACLVANGQKVALVERSSESVLPWTSGLPENTFDNPEYFQVGCYWNSVICTVGSNGELTLGVESPSITGGHVVIFDNFRLEYVGQVVTISDALYATYVAPVDVDFTDANVEAFAAQKVSEDWVHLEKVYTVPTGTAVVVKAATAGTYAINSTTGAVLGEENDLVAATTDVTADGSQYILVKQNDVVGFSKATPGTTIAAGKGYLVISGDAGVKGFYPFATDDATGINEVNGQWSMINGQPIYNLAGQRISKMQKGINIVDGKKVLK